MTIDGASRANALAPSAMSSLGQLYVLGFLALAVLLPLFALTLQAGSLKSFQLAWSSSFAEIQTSLLVSMAAASLATILAYLLACSMEDMTSPWKDCLHILTLFPLAFPAALFGIALIHLWNRPATQFVYAGYSILIIAYIARFIPFAVQIIIANIKQISPSMREAAWICESSRLKRLLYIDLPLVRRGLAICWIVVFIFSMGELGATLLVIPPGAGTLSLKIYTLMHYGAGPLVAALALLLITANLLVSSGLLFGARQR